ncbi:MAG: aminotransferase class I/II-fold pyridoxal phosphate-dependent enzyme [Pseudomonadota bacterium]
MNAGPRPDMGVGMAGLGTIGAKATGRRGPRSARPVAGRGRGGDRARSSPVSTSPTARAAGGRIIVASAALAGLDAVRAAAEGAIHRATILTRKPPTGLDGAPYLVARGITLAALATPRKVFEGGAGDGARPRTCWTQARRSGTIGPRAHEGTGMETSRSGRGNWVTLWVDAIPPYKGPWTPRDLPAGDPPVRALNLNECPYPPSPKAVAAIVAAAGIVGRYPDVECRALAAALAERTGLPPSRIVFGAGSDELIHLLCEISLGVGDVAVMPRPTFPRYALSAQIMGAAARKVRIDEAGANDAAGLVAAIDPRTRVVFASTPNAPSGGMMAASALDLLARGVPDNVLVVVDEAYHEFARHAGGPDVLAILKARRGPWAVTRTFSKAYGLGGLRVGYVLCGSDGVYGALRKAKLQYNVNTLAQVAAIAALDDRAHLGHVLDANARERQNLAEGLRALGLAPLPSFANFVSAELPFAAAIAIDGLRARRILVRDWRDPDYARHIRITVGLPDDTRAVLAALGETMAEQARGRAASA